MKNEWQMNFKLIKKMQLVPRFKDSAKSETSQLSRIRLGSLRDKFESRVGRLNSEETDSAKN